MPVLDNLSIELCSKQIVSAIFQGRSPIADWEKNVQAVIDQISPSLNPCAVYDWHKIKRLDDRGVMLIGSGRTKPVSINLGLHSDLVKPAHLILSAVVTIGQEIDTIIKRKNSAGQTLEAYLADCVGVHALMQVSRTIYREAEREAQLKNWGTGPVLSPGAIQGWRLEDQKRLCALLPLNQINVRLNRADVLIPQKSASFIVGIGPSYSLKNVGLACKVCTNSGACWCKY